MKTQDVAAKREALEELIQTDGWRYFVSHIAAEWQGNGYVARMRTALSKNDLLEPKVVDRAAQEISRLIQWPIDQVRELKGNVDGE